LKKLGSALLLAAAGGLTGCAGTPTQHREVLVDRSGIDLIGAPSDRVHIVIKDPKSFERYCKGPGPDVALTASAGVDLGANGGVVPLGGKVGTNASRGAVDLGGRNPAVLLAREMFYRTCELILNTNASPKAAVALFKMTMDAVERISATQTGTGATGTAAPPPAYPDVPDSVSSTISSTTYTPSILPPGP
jgi:hypothetical protein